MIWGLSFNYQTKYTHNPILKKFQVFFLPYQIHLSSGDIFW
jgi:hypothetical protein